MPMLQKVVSIIFDNVLDLGQVLLLETIICCQGNWFKPELCLTFSGLDMDVRRLLAFVAEEEESKATESQNSWHDLPLQNVVFGSCVDYFRCFSSSSSGFVDPHL